MSVKDKVFKGKLKHKGIYDYRALYEFTYDYLYEEEYEIHETSYQEVANGDAKNINVSWSSTRNISDYFQFEIKLNIIILGQKKVKIKKGDNEVSMDSGTLEINFDATLIKDYNNKWNSGFMKSLREIYDEHIIKFRIDDYEVQLFEEVNNLIAALKSYFMIEGQHII